MIVCAKFRSGYSYEMAENDDYLDSMDNNHLEGTNGSLNMTDNSLGVCNVTLRSWHCYKLNHFENTLT